jgi:hypothetical protein
MSDAQIRHLERLAAQGDLDAHRRLWFERKRAGLSPWNWWPEHFASLQGQKESASGLYGLTMHQTHQCWSGPRTSPENTGVDIVDELRRILDPPGEDRFNVAAILLEERPQVQDRNDLGVPTGWVTPVFMFTFLECGEDPFIVLSSHWSDPLGYRVDNWARPRKKEPILIREALAKRDIPILHVLCGFSYASQK